MDSFFSDRKGLRDRARTDDSRTRVDRLTHRFNSTSGSKGLYNCRAEGTVRCARNRAGPRTPMGPIESFFDVPGTHRRIFFAKRSGALACHDSVGYYIFLKQGTSVLHNHSNFYFPSVRLCL